MGHIGPRLELRCTPCAHQIASDATSCPQCGHRQWQQPGFSEMTLRIVVAIVALIALLFIVGRVVNAFSS